MKRARNKISSKFTLPFWTLIASCISIFNVTALLSDKKASKATRHKGEGGKKKRRKKIVLCIAIFNKTFTPGKASNAFRCYPLSRGSVNPPFIRAVFPPSDKKSLRKNPVISQNGESQNNTCERACITRNIIGHVTGVTHRVNERRTKKGGKINGEKRNTRISPTCAQGRNDKDIPI